ncbi:MAG TPA: sensor histidine kinase [Negativicutes bacterium]|nr:sensor histidine kinase [Negativicutes bacterium]
MSIFEYLKERWITFTFIIFTFLFSITVYILDSSFSIRESNAAYILSGWFLAFAAYVVTDYWRLRLRFVKFRDYCMLNASSGSSEDFTYPVDREYARLVGRITAEGEAFKAETETRSAEEMEFITKWLHDIKVPISAARLILENNENTLPDKFYRDMYTELFSIEESIQRVFYELKTNRFFDDYKITRVSTKRLIAQALKGYSNFFSYKRISLEIEGDDFEVLTDEKWSAYILSQFVSNAVKYSPDSGRIYISTVRNSDEICISVKNLGKGIIEKDLGQVFQKGYTSSENRAGMKATGYGLFLSKKLGDLLGHRLYAESVYNKYALFGLVFKENRMY